MIWGGLWRGGLALAASLAIAFAAAWCIGCGGGARQQASAVAVVANAGGARLADLYVATPGAENDPAWAVVWASWDRFVGAHALYAAAIEAGEPADDAAIVAAYCALLAAVPPPARPTIAVATVTCP